MASVSTSAKSDLPVGHKKSKKKRGVRSRSFFDEQIICDGEVKLFRTLQSGEVWQFRMWISTEKKYIRKSTRKRNLDDAKKVAREIWKQTIARMELSQPIFSITATELVELYLESKKEEVGINKTLGRWHTMRSQLSHYLNFVGPTEKITDIDRNIWDGYFRFRRKDKPNVKDATLVNEKSTIRSMYNFAIRHEYLPPRFLPEFTVIRTEVRKRRALELEEWRTIYEHMRRKDWSNVSDIELRSQRKMLYWAVLVLANTGIRFGELRRLRWNNIQRYVKRDNGTEVHIRLEKEQTKNKVARTVIGRRGDVFSSIKRHSNHTRGRDFVFVENQSETGEQLAKYIYYKLWNEMLEETGLQENSEENLSFYNLRHFYATQRLCSGADPYALAKSLGCSINYLWNHYGQVQTEMMARNLTKNVELDEDGQVKL